VNETLILPDILCNYDHLSEEERESYANLFAAAPLLRDALEAIRDEIDTLNREFSSYVSRLDFPIKEVLTFIAKRCQSVLMAVGGKGPQASPSHWHREGNRLVTASGKEILPNILNQNLSEEEREANVCLLVLAPSMRDAIKEILRQINDEKLAQLLATLDSPVKEVLTLSIVPRCQSALMACDGKWPNLKEI